VADDAWYAADVLWAYANGLFRGTEDNVFSPDLTVTRGMLVTVLGRMYGDEAGAYAQVVVEAEAAADATTGFDDVAPGKYYTPYVAWAQESGIVAGVGGNRFSPDAEITRQDLAVIITRYADFAKKQFPVTLQYAAFADEAEIAGYAQSAVQTLYCGGIVNGKPDNRFDPRGSTTRAEVAAILHRFIEAAR
jgi:hypothetical protein